MCSSLARWCLQRTMMCRRLELCVLSFAAEGASLSWHHDMGIFHPLRQTGVWRRVKHRKKCVKERESQLFGNADCTFPPPTRRVHTPTQLEFLLDCWLRPRDPRGQRAWLFFAYALWTTCAMLVEFCYCKYEPVVWKQTMKQNSVDKKGVFVI